MSLKTIVSKMIAAKEPESNIAKVIRYHKKDSSKINCEKCDHSWKVSDGGNDLYTCHECGYNNNKKTRSPLKDIVCPEGFENIDGQCVKIEDVKEETAESILTQPNLEKETEVSENVDVSKEPELSDEEIRERDTPEIPYLTNLRKKYKSGRLEGIRSKENITPENPEGYSEQYLIFKETEGLSKIDPQLHGIIFNEKDKKEIENFENQIKEDQEGREKILNNEENVIAEETQKVIDKLKYEFNPNSGINKHSKRSIELYKELKDTGNVTFNEDELKSIKKESASIQEQAVREFDDDIDKLDMRKFVAKREEANKVYAKSQQKKLEIPIKDNVDALNKLLVSIETSKANNDDPEFINNNINEANVLIGQLKKDSDNYFDLGVDLKDIQVMIDAYKVDYSASNRIGAVLKSTGYDIAMAATGTVDMLRESGILATPEQLETLEEGALSKDLIKEKEELDSYIAEYLPKKIEVGNIRNIDDFGNFFGDTWIDFSASAAVMAVSTVLPGSGMALFGAMGYGARLNEFAQAKKEADERLPGLQASLEDKITKNSFLPGERESLEKQIEGYKEASEVSNLVKFGTATIYGGAELLGEKFGSLAILNKMTRFRKAFPGKAFNEGIANGITQALKEIPAGITREVLSEGLTQVAQNSADIILTNADKSLFEGVDEAGAAAFLTGGGLSLIPASNIARAAVLDVISTKEDKAKLKTQLTEIDRLQSIILQDNKVTKKAAKEQRDIIISEVERDQDITIDRFLKLPFEQQQEVMELDRRSRAMNTEWVEIVNDPSTSESDKSLIRKGLQTEFDTIQERRRGIINKNDQRFKKQKVIKGLDEGDQRRNEIQSDLGLRKIKESNKKDLFADLIVGVTEMDVDLIKTFIKEGDATKTIELEDGTVLDQSQAELIAENATITETSQGSEFKNGFFDPETKTIGVFTQRAPIANKGTAVHEYIHAALDSAGFTEDQYNEIQQSLDSTLSNAILTGEITEDQKDNILNQINTYEKGQEQSKEILTAISDAIYEGVITSKDTGFFENISNIIGDTVNSIIGKESAANLNINNPEGAFEFVKDFNKKVLKGGKKATIKGGVIDEQQKTKSQDSKSTLSKPLLESINKLIPNTVKTKEDFQNPRVFNKVYESIVKQDGAINNYIKSRSESVQEGQKIIENVTDRLIKFDPETKRADGTPVGIEGFGESIFANTRFGKLDARKDLFKESQKKNKETSIDTPQAKALFSNENIESKTNKIGINEKQSTLPTALVEDIVKSFENNTLAAEQALTNPKAKKEMGKASEKVVIPKTNKKKTTARNKAFSRAVANSPSSFFKTNKDGAKEQLNVGQAIKQEMLKSGEVFDNYINKNWDQVGELLTNREISKNQNTRQLLEDWQDNGFTKEDVIEYFADKSLAKNTRADRKNEGLYNAILDDVSNKIRISEAKKNPETAKSFTEKSGFPLASKSTLNKPASELDREFRLKSGNIDLLLQKYLKRGKYDLKDKKQIKEYVKDLEKYVFPLFPKKFIFTGNGTGMLTPSKRVIGGVSKAFTKEMLNENNDLYKKLLKESSNKFKNWGPDFVGVTDLTRRLYENGKAVGSTEAIQKRNFENGTTAEFNRNNLAIWDQMWNRINLAIVKDKNAAISIGNFMSLVGNLKNHPHRLGAEVVARSLNPKGGKDRVFEFEHAMPATGAYLYLMDSILSGRDFAQDLKAVQRNYKVIALDKSLNYKLNDAGLGLGMPEGWKVFSNSWLERYFNPTVAVFDGGIDPSSLMGINGLTIEEQYGVKANGITKKQKTLASKGRTFYEDGDGISQIQAPLSKEFNKMLEKNKGIKSEAIYSEARAAKMGAKKGFQAFVPYSAEDFLGLIYPMLGKGEQGNKDLKWWKDNVMSPYNDGMTAFESSKQAAMIEWKQIKEQIKDTPANLSKEAVRDFSNEDAARVYLWNKKGAVPNDLSKKDIKALTDYVENNPELKAFANQVSALNINGYPDPTKGWLAGTITTDLVNHVNTTTRSEMLAPWQQAIDDVYTKDNKNKLRATFGDKYIEALDDSLYRMKTGRNRPSGANRITNNWLNWVNDSVGTIMFFNQRSAILQTISSINFINWSDNNPAAAAKAFANQKQYWSDFSYLFNSDFLKQRRSGLKTDVNADEIAQQAAGSTNKVRAGLSWLLKKGFLPTQIADSFAIASGGSTFYRNRVNSLVESGLSKADAEKQAFSDFRDSSNESQQSSDPSRVSMEQASSLGRVILAFANTPIQYTRLTKRAVQDLAAGRGDWKSNVSKILYYGAVQNIIFTTLQQAMFGMLFSDDDDEFQNSRKDQAAFNIANSTVDTFLRGSGVAGAFVAMLKNMALEIKRQNDKKRPDYTKVADKLFTVSPPIDSKFKKLQSAGRTFTYKQELKKIRDKGVALDNPAFMAIAKVVSAFVNIPADRVLKKLNNIVESTNNENAVWQRIALMMGWGEWELGITDRKTNQARAKNDSFKGLEKSIKKVVKKRKKEEIKEAKEDKKTPIKALEAGVLGEANRDGSIVVAKGLSKEKRKEVIRHEKVHQKEISSGKLDYDEGFVYYGKKKYERNNGKIMHNGKAKVEGDHSLPWEKVAHKH